jgi:diguanylate cyclase (GGDEF)-like protein
LSLFRTRITLPKPLWFSAGLILLFNSLLFTWLLINTNNQALLASVDYWAQTLGPLLMLPFGFLALRRLWRRWTSGRGALPPDRPGKLLVPLLLGLSLLGFTVGQGISTYYESVLYQPIPFPSWADAAYLGAYPFLFLAILLLPTRRLSIISRTRILLDGLMFMAGVITFSWYFILGPTLFQGNETLFGKIVGTAYPAAELVMVFSLLLLSFRSRDAALEPALRILFFALIIMIFADSIYDYQTLQGTYAAGELLDVTWPLGYMLIGLAAQALYLALGQQNVSPATGSDQASAGEATEDIPSVGRSLLPYALVPAVGLLAIYIWHTGGNGILDWGVYLGGAVLIGIVVLRQVFAIRETVTYARELHTVQGQLRAKNQIITEANTRLEALATTDPLTGLPNHRALVATLDQELKRSARYGRSCTLLFLDLDHFKALNDGYGHLTGDAVLQEFSALVRAQLRGMDTLGRWGGEEFVALLPETDTEGAQTAAEYVRASVASHTFAVGGGVRLTCSVGIAIYPFDSEERDGLIRAADQAMYGAKKLGRNQVRTVNDAAVIALATELGESGSREEAALAGTVEALVALVEARDRYTGRHTHRVAPLTMQLAMDLGQDAAEAHMISMAGRLYDIGKVALPDAVLRKPDRLTEEEWTLMRQHPVVGAEVVSHVPSLRALAPVIRAHHEWWNGHGYPDKLVGEAIPLGARIVAVVDAYLAMTTDRPFQQAHDTAWALAELRHCAGTQFDPGVVQAFERILMAEQVLSHFAEVA